MESCIYRVQLEVPPLRLLTSYELETFGFEWNGDANAVVEYASLSVHMPESLSLLHSLGSRRCLEILFAGTHCFRNVLFPCPESLVLEFDFCN
jgi:hypothetical protein